MERNTPEFSREGGVPGTPFSQISRWGEFPRGCCPTESRKGMRMRWPSRGGEPLGTQPLEIPLTAPRRLAVRQPGIPTSPTGRRSRRAESGTGCRQRRIGVLGAALWACLEGGGVVEITPLELHSQAGVGVEETSPTTPHSRVGGVRPSFPAARSSPGGWEGVEVTLPLAREGKSPDRLGHYRARGSST
jgi:hypothetical protein